MSSIAFVAGSKQIPRLSSTELLEEPWTTPVGTENDMKKKNRALLSPGYPDDLSRESTPETGSIGNKGMPIENRKAPFTLKGKR